jgi:Mg2+ and Co2+ transporter CorA
VGSIGQGKSTLASFLYNPLCENDGETPRFVGNHNFLAVTSDIDQADLKDYNLTVVDSPGLNESSAADATHMAALLNVLTTTDVALVVLCCKSMPKLDAQLKKTINFYAHMLAINSTMSLAFVVTDHSMSPEKVRQRKKESFDFEVWKEKFVGAVRETCPLIPKNVNVWPIDSRACSYDEEPYQEAISTRTKILEYASKVAPVDAKSLRYPKTEAMQNSDRVSMESLKAFNIGYSRALAQSEGMAKQIETDIKALMQSTEAAAKQQAEAGLFLAEFDIPDHMIPVLSEPLVGQSCTVVCRKPNGEPCTVRFFTVTSISDYHRNNQDPSVVELAFSTDISPSSQARIGIYAYAREFYSEEIAQCRLQKQEAETNLESLVDKCSALNALLKTTQEHMDRLSKRYEDTQKEMACLVRTSLPLKEALDFLGSMYYAMHSNDLIGAIPPSMRLLSRHEPRFSLEQSALNLHESLDERPPQDFQFLKLSTDGTTSLVALSNSTMAQIVDSNHATWFYRGYTLAQLELVAVRTWVEKQLVELFPAVKHCRWIAPSAAIEAPSLILHLDGKEIPAELNGTNLSGLLNSEHPLVIHEAEKDPTCPKTDEIKRGSPLEIRFKTTNDAGQTVVHRSLGTLADIVQIGTQSYGLHCAHTFWDLAKRSPEKSPMPPSYEGWHPNCFSAGIYQLTSSDFKAVFDLDRELSPIGCFSSDPRWCDSDTCDISLLKLVNQDVQLRYPSGINFHTWLQNSPLAPSRFVKDFNWGSLVLPKAAEKVSFTGAASGRILEGALTDKVGPFLFIRRAEAVDNWSKNGDSGSLVLLHRKSVQIPIGVFVADYSHSDTSLAISLEFLDAFVRRTHPEGIRF